MTSHRFSTGDKDFNTHWSVDSLSWGWQRRLMSVLWGAQFFCPLNIRPLANGLENVWGIKRLGKPVKQGLSYQPPPHPQSRHPHHHHPPKQIHWKTEACRSVLAMINLSVSLWNLKEGEEKEAFLFPIESNHSSVSLGVYIKRAVYLESMLIRTPHTHDLLYIPFPFCLFFFWRGGRELCIFYDNPKWLIHKKYRL